MKSLLLAVILLAQTPTPVQVQTGQTVQIGQTGTITGRLLALNGTPAAGIRVSAMPASESAKPSVAASSDVPVLASLGQTDATGRFRLENLPPGRYYVLAGFLDFPTYYPGVMSTMTATAVSVTARATVSGIDFQAARASTGLTLRGRLKRDTDEGVGGLNVSLNGNDQNANARSMPDGSFEFSKLRPGTYSISMSGPSFQPKQIILTDKDITDMELVVPWTVDVKGTVSVEGGGPRPNFSLTFAGGTRGVSTTGARESFQMTLQEGAYAIASNGLPSGFFIKSIQSGSLDLQKDPLILSRTAPPPPINVTLGVSSPPPWVKLSGRVTGLSKPATADPRISLFGSTGESLEAPIATDGSFEFSKLLPGTYTVNVRPAPASLPGATILVPNSDLNGVLLSFPAVKEVDGRITVDDGGPIPTAAMSLTGTFGVTLETGPPTLAQLLVGSSQPRNSMSVNMNLQQDGTFKASLPEGEYRVTVMPQFQNTGGSVYVVKSFTYGATDLMKDSVSVKATDSASMRLTLGPVLPVTWSKVTGRVTGLDASLLAVSPPTVTLNASGLLTNWTAPVKSDGSFEFPKIYPGTYTVRVVSPNTVNFGSVGNLNFSAATASITLAGADVSGLEIAVPRQKEISGRVILEGRGIMPRFAIPLTPSPAVPSFGGRAAQALVMNITPQSDGSFKVTLPEGERQAGVANNLPAGYAVKSLMYGTTDLLKNPMKVIASDDAELRVTLTTPNLAPVRVGGKITGVDDAVTARGPFTATLNGTGNTVALRAPVNADHSFQFPEVFPGDYTVRVIGSGIIVPSAVTVTVANADVANIEIAIPRQKEISGRVILEGRGPMPRFQIQLQIATAGTGNSSVSFVVNPQGDGTFKVTVPVGEHRSSALTAFPAGYAAKTVMYGDTDILKNPMRIAESDNIELRVTVTTPNLAPVRVRGRVTGLDDSIFARGPITVSMTSTAYVSTLSTPVKADRTFEFPEVFSGNYSSRVAGSGFASPASVPITVANVDIANIEIAVLRQIEVTGRVILEGSGPMARIVFPLIPDGVPVPSAGQITAAVAAATGLFPGTSPSSVSTMVINPQADGIFRVILQEGERRVGTPGGLPPGYAVKSLTYGVTDLLKNPLKVTPSDTFEMRAVLTTSNSTPFRVSGRIIGLDAASFARGPVNAVMTSTTYGATLNATVHTDGTFEFPSVYPGTFALRAVGPSVLNSPNMTVNVANADIRDIEIRVPALRDITGHLVIEGGGPYPSLTLPLSALPSAIGAPGPSSGTLPTIRPGTDGSFHIGLPEGETRASNFIGLPPGYTVKSFTYGSTDVLKNPLKIAADGTAELQITLVNTAIPVKVSGRVDGVDLGSPAGAPVRVTMQSPSFVVPLTADVRADGTFEFSKVYPGNYRLFAVKGSSSQTPLSLTPLIVGDKAIEGVVVAVSTP